MLVLINDILDLSKIETGVMDFYPEHIGVADLLDEVVRMVSPIAAKKDIDLTYDVDPQLKFIIADREKLKQILLNLLSNAIKFTGQAGKVSIEAGRYGENIRFLVKDTGIGISKEDHGLLFGEFTQVDSSRNRKYEGTGLGLALVKKFVDMHKGKVWVESEPGKGSCFYVEIPIDDKQ